MIVHRNLALRLVACVACVAAWAGAGHAQGPAGPPPASAQTAPQLAGQPATQTSPALSMPLDRQGRKSFLTDENDKDKGPSTRDLLARMLAAMVVILVLGVLAIVVIKRVLPRINRIRPGGKRVSVAETVYLGPRKSLHLVQVGGRKLLIASTKEQISMLADVTGGFEQILEDKQK